MCIKIVREEMEIAYDTEKPLEDQLAVSDKILIDFEPNDKALDKFVQEINRLTKSGSSQSLNIEVVHNNHLVGLKLKKNMIKAVNDITMNEMIKMMASGHAAADKRLEELANLLYGCKL